MSADPNPLWEFAVDCYRRPGVAPPLLTLQDDHGADVMLLLAAAWCAVGQRPVTADVAARWWSQTADCRRLVTDQRGLRRDLRVLAGHHSVYQDAKMFEQRLERWQSEQLLALLPEPNGVERPSMLANLRAVMPPTADRVEAGELLAELVRRIDCDPAPNG